MSNEEGREAAFCTAVMLTDLNSRKWNGCLLQWEILPVTFKSNRFQNLKTAPQPNTEWSVYDAEKNGDKNTFQSLSIILVARA
jgi:hypothetical protein